MTSKLLKYLLLTAQILLAITLVWAGFSKLVQPETLPWPWIKENPELVKFTGVLDLIAGFGLIVPTLLRLASVLTVYAAMFTMALMLGAIVFHISRGEADQIGFNIFVFVVAALIAWGKKKNTPV